MWNPPVVTKVCLFCRNKIQNGFYGLLFGEAADYSCAEFWASNGQLWERRSLVLHVHDMFWQTVTLYIIG